MTELLLLPSGQRRAITRQTGGERCALLLHGFPCTRRLYDRVVPGAAAAGWDAVAVDLRGFGESDLPTDGRYDLGAHAEDLSALLDRLGHRGAVLVAHDLGASVALQLTARRPELVEGLLLMNHVVPVEPSRTDLGGWSAVQRAEIFDYADQQGHHAEQLVRRLSSPRDRMDYVADFYTGRGWCPPGNLSAGDVGYLVEPFASRERLRASFRDYEIIAGSYPAPADPEPGPGEVRCPVQVLLGTDDVTLVPQAQQRCEAAYPNLVGVGLVPDAGHFLPWERPARVVSALAELAQGGRVSGS